MKGIFSRAGRLILRCGDERGQALVIALIVMSALTISIAGVISYTTGHETQTDRDRSSQRAFHVAEAGLNNATSVVMNTDTNDGLGAGATLSGSIPASGPGAIDGAVGTYSATKYAANDPRCQVPNGANPGKCWVIVSSAVSNDHRVTRQLTETIYWNTQTKDEPNIYQYGLVVFNQPGGDCVSTQGGANLTLTIRDVWIGGDYCPGGGAKLMPPSGGTGSFYIGGVFKGTNNSELGDPAAYYGKGTIIGGCTVQGHPQTCSDFANSNVYADDWSGLGTTLEKPTIDAQSKYDDVEPGNAVCTGAGKNYFASGALPTDPGKMDDNTSMDHSLGTVTLMPSGSSFSCTTSDGTLSWNSSTNTLNITGAIFIDGNVNLSNGGNYTGSGTIYINGTVRGSSNMNICGPAGCGSTDPSNASLGLVVIDPPGPYFDQTAFRMTGNGELDITLLCNQGYADTGGTNVMGPVLADTATIRGSSGQIVPNVPPDQMPSTVVESANWVILPGTWQQNH